MHLCKKLVGCKGQLSQGYLVIGETIDGRWGKLLPDTSQDWSRDQLEERRREWERQQQVAKAERLAKEMPAAERDRHYRWILNQLDLHLEDRQDLIRRGYTDEQIERAGHKSVDQWQKLPKKLPLNLPGINSRGDGLITHTAGYLCPITDCDGLIVGFQVRKRHLAPDDDQRYYFLSQNGSIRISDQVPLAVFEPIERKADYYGTVEGVGVKPFLACDRLGVPVIGAAGGNWLSSAIHLKNSLQKLGAKSGDKVVLFADAGSPKNPSVLRQYKRAVSELKQQGYQPLIAWWSQLDKSDPDVDELNSLQGIKFIKPKRFWDMCNHISQQAQRDEKLRQQRLKKEEDFLCPESEQIDKSVSEEALPKEVPQLTSTPNQQTSKGKSQKPGKSLSRTTNQKLHSLPQSTTFSILNPPLIVSPPTQPLKDGTLKVLPIPESVASCLTTEAKAPRQERKWFDKVLKRVKKVFSKNAKKEKAPRLGFKCFKEDNPDFEEKIRQVQRKLRSLSYEADIDLSQRYLPNELANQLPKSGLIGIKAPKGCGKSVLLKEIIALAKKQGIAVLSITPRIALGREQAVKWEITWIDDYGTMQTRAEDTTRQIEEVAKKRSEATEKLIDLEKVSYQQLNLLDETETLNIEQQKADLRTEIEQYGQEIDNINAASVKTLALCWDSLWRTKDRDLKESLIVIDEAELGLKHFVSGSTCKRNRPYLLKVFKDKLVESLMSGGRVILSDADLTDLSINYVREILPIPLKPFIVTNTYVGQETRWMVDLRTGNRGSTLSEIVEAIHDGAYLAITTDSQREAEALEEHILQEFPHDFCAFLDADGNITTEAQAREKALIVRVDSTTTETEAGKKFIQKPNEQTLHWKPRILIYTPSMGVGVSIDETTQRWDEQRQEMMPYFDAVYGLFLGVIEPSQCRQQLARVRANVPRIVYCKESNKALEGCSSFFPAEVKRQTLKYHQSALSILDIAKGVAGYEADDEEIRAVMLQLLVNAWDKDSRCWKEPSIDLASAFKARENYSLWNLANLLREELQDEGHTVVLIQGVKTPLIEEMADIKDGKKAKVATLLANSSTMPLEEARKVINTLGATKEQKLSAHKTLLQDELPEVNLTPEFVKKAVVDDHRRWLNQQRLFWHFTNRAAVEEIDTNHWVSNLRKFAEGVPFMRDIRSNTPKVDALRKSGIFEFVDVENCDRIYQSDTPEAEAFVKRCLRNKDDLQTALNVLVTKKSSPIGLANRILGKVGLRLEKLTRSNKDNRWRLSADLVNDPDRVSVLKAFELRWQMSQQEAEKKLGEKQAQTQSKQAIQPGGESPCYIDQNIDCPPVFEGVSQGDIQSTVETAAARKSELEQLIEAEKKSTEKQAQTQSQQAIQPGGGSPIYIDQNIDCPPVFEGVSQGDSQLTLDAVAAQKSELEELIQALPFAESPEVFASIVEGSPPEIVEDAIALSGDQPRRLQLHQWYESLKQASERPTLASYTPGDEVWAYFPQSESRWLKGAVQWIRGNTIRVVSGIFGTCVEREDAIAPGNWVLSG